jgi:hypothetical protein
MPRSIILVLVLAVLVSLIPQNHIIIYPDTQKRIENYALFGSEKDKLRYKLFKAVLESGLSLYDFVVLDSIAHAESSWRHYDKNGNVLSGKINKADKGLFQINTAVHNLAWQTPEDNIRSAIELYKQYGTKPWIYSKSKWQKNLNTK